MQTQPPEDFLPLMTVLMRVLRVCLFICCYSVRVVVCDVNLLWLLINIFSIPVTASALCSSRPLARRRIEAFSKTEFSLSPIPPPENPLPPSRLKHSVFHRNNRAPAPFLHHRRVPQRLKCWT
ncbi:hypothetical protein CKAN_00805900 [Cinnamomum micranthum f. kanehirae]|uniref:Uncharacterized protein n=1 Tax=Cinnamomum micranthum f. kanehirae TaxID=337451 RepID=A0A443NLW9_9MAGN|nr:hypothetical protein CKAN_00805900 [Cinnamomum micranthum f. kanehirae]